MIEALINGLGWPMFIGVAGLLGGFFCILHALYIRYRYQEFIDRAVMGSEYFDMGVFFAFSKLLMYGHYCIFSKRAIRAGVDELFQALPKVQRIHLIVYWWTFIIFGSLLFGGAAFDYFFS